MVQTRIIGSFMFVASASVHWRWKACNTYAQRRKNCRVCWFVLNCQKLEVDSSLAFRVQHLSNEGAYAVMNRSRQLDSLAKTDAERVIHFEIGQPISPSPVHVTEALVRAVRAGETKYVDPKGMGELRCAIARYLERTRELEAFSIDENLVVVGPGAKPGLFLSCLALLNPGDEVLIPDPGFPTYWAMSEVCGATPVTYPLSEETNAADVGAIERLISSRTKLIVVNSPGNPTGGILDTEGVNRLKDIMIKSNGRLWLMTDEIYP